MKNLLFVNEKRKEDYLGTQSRRDARTQGHRDVVEMRQGCK